ncbi:hypothetical protein PH552_12450 [Rhizobium sp. CNPSo 3968]|uniref:hypothetical protein n=1 Tax=Rhizobium sp. CNPSo 3968 TaxID=3021408 RepID=UPI00254C7379|nr:hypothetical protein [Rhizobium sp. CNPSo 3968]MDK4720155.1 hypothetical protein [Rhizobium sp. CNPSo 3968]
MEKEPEIIRTSLRLPIALYNKIFAAAEKRGVTMHAEILSRLEETDMAKDALIKAVEMLEDLKRRSSDEMKVLRWLLEQQKLMSSLIEEIAASDGNLDPTFVKSLRRIVATKGKDNSFPKLTQDDE